MPRSTLEATKALISPQERRCHLANTTESHFTPKRILNHSESTKKSIDRHQNLITSFLSHAELLGKIHQNSFVTFELSCIPKDSTKK